MSSQGEPAIADPLSNTHEEQESILQSCDQITSRSTSVGVLNASNRRWFAVLFAIGNKPWAVTAVVSNTAKAAV
jgi:hypothetical protein